MTNIVLYGDGLICPPHGYGETFADLLALRCPSAAVQTFQTGGEALDLDAGLKGAAFHVIGKAPDLVFLNFGHSDLVKKNPVEKMAASMALLLQLLIAKTQANIVFASCFPTFLSEEFRENGEAYNSALKPLTSDRAIFLDLNTPILDFLAKHHQNSGEIRALHQNPLRLTSMGRILLAHAALDELLRLKLIIP